MVKKIRREEVRKLMDLVKDILIGKSIDLNTSKTKQIIHSQLPMGRQVFNHLQESKAPSYVMVIWEDKCYHSVYIYIYIILFFFFPMDLYTEHDTMVWNIPWVTCGQLSQLHLLPLHLQPACCWDGV